MDLKRSVLTAMLVGGLATPAFAQGDPAPPPKNSIDANRLGIDVNRIQRQLKQDASRGERDGINLKYYLDVYGTAPAFQLFANPKEATQGGPVPWGGPTNREMLNIMTPPEFRAPVMDFSALTRWLRDRSK
jgi:hypothetical protein